MWLILYIHKLTPSSYSSPTFKKGKHCFLFMITRISDFSPNNFTYRMQTTILLHWRYHFQEMPSLLLGDGWLTFTKLAVLWCIFMSKSITNLSTILWHGCLQMHQVRFPNWIKDYFFFPSTSDYESFLFLFWALWTWNSLREAINEAPEGMAKSSWLFKGRIYRKDTARSPSL